MRVRMLGDSVFLAGNLEAQRLSKELTKRSKYLFVRRHFIYSCLLSENVYFPAANYFQSDITQKLTREFASLFRATDVYPQLVHIAINPSKENFRGEALEKKETYQDVPDYQGYMDDLIRERLVNELNSITTPFMRKGKLISSLNDYVHKETGKEGVLYNAIYKMTGSEKETKKIFRPLLNAVEKNDKAIIPEYIMQFDDEYVINDSSEQMIRLCLLKAYAESLGKHYEAYVCNPLVYTYQSTYIFPYELNFLDTYLFDLFLRLFDDIHDQLLRISADQLRKIKYSERFGVFLEGYHRFIIGLCEKSVPFSDIQQYISLEKNEQNKRYIKVLKDFVTDTEMASILYKSMFGIKARMKKMFGCKIIKTDVLIESDSSIFLYALVNEVYETFLNRYNSILIDVLRQSHKGIKERKIIMFNKINMNQGGNQVIVTKSKDVQIINNTNAENINSLSRDDLNSIIQFADNLSKYQGNEFKQSEKIKLSACLYEIGDVNEEQEKRLSKIREFRDIYNSMKEIGKKTVVSLASGILSKMIMEILGIS